jgi:chromatin remodeling complex protein RSC6
MVRQTKTTTTAPVAAPVVAPVAVSVTVEASAPAEKKPRKTKAASATAPVASSPVSSPASSPVSAPVAAPVSASVSAPVVEVDASALSSKLNDFGSKIAQIASLLTTMKSDYKLLEKQVAKEVKQKAGKGKKVKAAPNPNRKPSGFVKPSVITEELSRFLGKEVGVMLSRVEVSKEITKYINENNLKDKDCGRQINPDAKLTKLLNIEAGGEPLTFFNLQKYLKVHFVKAPVV